MTVKRALALIATLILLPLGLPAAIAASVPGDEPNNPIPIPAKAIPHSFAVNTAGSGSSLITECEDPLAAIQWFSYTPRDDTVLRLEQGPPPRSAMHAYAATNGGPMAGENECAPEQLLHAGQKYLIVVGACCDARSSGVRATLTFNLLPSPVTKLRVISASVIEPMNVVVVTGVATCNTNMFIFATGKLTQVVSGKVQATADASFADRCDARTGVVPWSVALAPAGKPQFSDIVTNIVGTFEAGQPTTWTGDVHAQDTTTGRDNITHLERVPIQLQRVVVP